MASRGSGANKDSVVLIFGLLAVHFLSASCSTIDLFEALRRVPPVSYADQTSDLFGYSAVLHHTADPYASGSISDKLDGARILIGVPRGRVVSSVNTTGYVLQCSVSPPADCSVLVGEDITETPTSDEFTGMSSFQYFDDMLLGAAMATNGRNVMVCGHKYISSFIDNSFQGLCVRLEKNLTQSIVRTVDKGTNRNGVLDVLTYDSKDGSDYIYSLGGISVDVLDDNNFVLGNLGVDDFRGGAYYSIATDRYLFQLSETPSPSSYAGYAVTSGRVFASDSEALIITAPRGNDLLGSVYIAPATDRVRTDERDGSVVTVHNVDKKHIGSAFGYSVAAVDYNGDSFDDLLVGAPYYYSDITTRDSGAVYVYLNVPGGPGRTFNETPSSILQMSPPQRGARFGHALASVGDLNNDGFSDVAISAPFYESGVVFIYLGHTDGLLSEPGQTIEGKGLNLLTDILNGISSFGTSLQGNVDIDGNTYNDLVIGAFESRQVFTLRARTVALLDVTLTANVSSVAITTDPGKRCDLGGISYICFSVQPCFKISGRVFESGRRFDVEFTVTGDTNSVTGITESRVVMTTDGQSSVTSTISLLLNASDSQCADEYPIYLSNSEASLETIFTEPLRPRVTAAVVQGDKPAPSDGSPVPVDLVQNRIFTRILNEQNTMTDVLGERECGGDGTCNTDITIDADYNLRFFNGSPSNVPIIFDGLTSSIAVDLTIGVLKDASEPAYGTRVTLRYPAFLRYDAATDISCNSPADGVAMCLLSSSTPIRPDEEKKVSVSFQVVKDNSSNSYNDTQLTFPIFVEATSGPGTNDSNLANNDATVYMKISPSTNISISMVVNDNVLSVEAREGLSRSGLPSSPEQLGQRIRFDVTVSNEGPSMVKSGVLQLRIPFRSACNSETTFLYYIESITTDLDIEAVEPANAVNILGFGNGSTSSEIPAVGGTCNTDQLTIVITCESDGCAIINLQVSNFANKDSHRIGIVGYIDEVFVLSTRNHFDLEFSADFNISDSNVLDPFGGRRTVGFSIINPTIVSPAEEIPLWAIIVPIVVGVLLLVALIVALYLCGFFKRRQKWKPEEEELTGAEGGEENGENTINSDPTNAPATAADPPNDPAPNDQ